MNSKVKRNEERLHIFHEIRKRRVFVGELSYVKEKDQYELIYDKKYVGLKNAIAIGPGLDLFKTRHVSKKGELFPIFQDRIPSRMNPAYEDYCDSQGISVEEKNPIILLGTIGKKGPSSFIFEPIYENNFTTVDIKKLRESLEISQHDLALALDISKGTLQKIELGTSKDQNTIKLLRIFFEFPEVALWQLKQSGGRIHSSVLSKLINYFKQMLLSLEGSVKIKGDIVESTGEAWEADEE